MRTFTISEDLEIESGKYKCPECGKILSKVGLAGHFYSLHTENGRSHLNRSRPQNQVGFVIWNKGKTKENTEGVAKISKTLKEGIKDGKYGLSFAGRIQTRRSKDKLSIRAKERKFGGKTYKKSFKYLMKDKTNIYLDSSFELSVAKSLDENNILWKRPKSFYWTDIIGSVHRYTPDFYLVDFDTYLDPKNNYLIEQDKDKIKRVSDQNNVKIIVLKEEELNWKDISEKIIGATHA